MLSCIESRLTVCSNTTSTSTIFITCILTNTPCYYNLQVKTYILNSNRKMQLTIIGKCRSAGIVTLLQARKVHMYNYAVGVIASTIYLTLSASS